MHTGAVYKLQLDASDSYEVQDKPNISHLTAVLT